MSRPYNIPRNYKGENKILYIFSTKAFIYTGVGAIIGVILYFLINGVIIKFLLKMKNINLIKIEIILVLVFSLCGFVIGTFKMPESNRFELTRKTGGEPLDQIILRWIKFKRKKKKIYIYKYNKGEN